MLSLGLVFDRRQAQDDQPVAYPLNFGRGPRLALSYRRYCCTTVSTPPRREGSWVMSRHCPLGSDKAELTVLRLGSESVVVFAI